MAAQTIAIVNDNAVLSGKMQRLLESEGYLTRLYKGGEEAQEMIDDPADLALLDKSSGGTGLFKQLREQTNMPVVFVSAWAEELEAQNIGADGYVGLPLLGKDLLRVVRYVLSRSNVTA